jgi:hypothetical protein
LTQRDVFCDGVVLAIAGSRGKGGKRCRPDIVDAVLHRVGHGLDTQIDSSIDLGDAGAALMLTALLDDPQKCACRRRAIILVGATGGECVFVRSNTGLKLCPLCRDFSRRRRNGLQAKWLCKHWRARVALICSARREHRKPRKIHDCRICFWTGLRLIDRLSVTGEARFRRVWICGRGTATNSHDEAERSPHLGNDRHVRTPPAARRRSPKRTI